MRPSCMRRRKNLLKMRWCKRREERGERMSWRRLSCMRRRKKLLKMRWCKRGERREERGERREERGERREERGEERGERMSWRVDYAVESSEKAKKIVENEMV